MLGLSVLWAAMRYGEHTFNSKAAPAMCSIALAAVSFLMIPQIVYSTIASSSDDSLSKNNTLILSHGMAIVFLQIFGLYAFLRLLPASHILDERVFLGEGAKRKIFSFVPPMIVLGFTTLCAFVCGAYLIDSLRTVVESSHFGQDFLFLIVVPMVTGYAELATAIFYTYGDTMNLAISVVVGSGMQIPLLILPSLVIIGWLANIQITLLLGGMESLLLFLSVLVLNYHVRDGNSTYVASTILLAT